MCALTQNPSSRNSAGAAGLHLRQYTKNPRRSPGFWMQNVEPRITEQPTSRSALEPAYATILNPPPGQHKLVVRLAPNMRVDDLKTIVLYYHHSPRIFE